LFRVKESETTDQACRSITADSLLQATIEECQVIRHLATARRKGKTPVVCGKCGFPVYLAKNGLNGLYYWRHYKGAPETCPWYSGSNLTPDQASAMQFNGAQESPLHIRLKHLIGELLEADSVAANVIVDQNLPGSLGHRKPDVRAIYDNRPIVIELQLSSTQLPIILERENFYRQEDWSLIWVTWNQMQVAQKNLRQGFLDIATRHNFNLFSIDEETIRLSKETSKFYVRAFWWDDGQSKSKIVTLNEFIFDDNNLAYVVAGPKQWHVRFKEEWLSITPIDGSSWTDRQKLWPSLIEKIDVVKFPTDFESDNPELGALINLLLSIEGGKIVGSKQSNLTEMLNTFFLGQGRHGYWRIVTHVLRVTENQHLLDVPSTKKKLECAKKVAPVGKDTTDARVVRALFPQWIK
jgi:hypothetical protein